MPDRILRDELLTSDRWLRLGGKDMAVGNARRLAFIACISTADTLGNMEATSTRLERLWRDFGIADDEAIEATLADFVRVDLARVYQDDDGKRFLHLPRYGQRLRYLGRLCPLSPWTSDEEKQELIKKSPGAHVVTTGRAPGANTVTTSESPARTGRSPDEVKRSEVIRREVKGEENDYARATSFGAIAASAGLQSKTVLENPSDPTPTPNTNGNGFDDWWLTIEGIKTKGKTLGMVARPGEEPRAFKDRIVRALQQRKATP